MRKKLDRGKSISNIYLIAGNVKLMAFWENFVNMYLQTIAINIANPILKKLPTINLNGRIGREHPRHNG